MRYQCSKCGRHKRKTIKKKLKRFSKKEKAAIWLDICLGCGNESTVEEDPDEK